MLTLRRFRAMADSYGADLQRWPTELRGEAEALLHASAEARVLLDEARKLDEAIAAASAIADAGHWRPGAQDAALARLRSGVEARIAASKGRSQPDRRLDWRLHQSARWVLPRHLRLTAMAAAGGCAIMAGLLLGSMYVSEPVSDGALAVLLQPTPIHILSD